MSTVSTTVLAWHKEVGHCKHNIPYVQTEPSCCVCDCSDPCERILEDIEEHDCVEFLDTWDWKCKICGAGVDPADATCSYCNGFPCHCDEAYERLKDERMGI